MQGLCGLDGWQDGMASWRRPEGLGGGTATAAWGRYGAATCRSGRPGYRLLTTGQLPRAGGSR